MSDDKMTLYFRPTGKTTTMRIIFWAATMLVAFLSGMILSAVYVYPKAFLHEDFIGIARYNSNGELVPAFLGVYWPPVVEALTPGTQTQEKQELVRIQRASCPQELEQCRTDLAELENEVCTSIVPQLSR
jgi:hypothetical protein